jgi:predicted nucleic acid-binding protein
MTFIYFIEKHPTYHPIVRPLFELLDNRDLFGLSSFITLLEVMVHPIKKGRFDLARAYRDRLVQANNFGLFPVDQPIAEHGADIRAKYEFKTPDAIQLATALGRAPTHL